MKKLDKSRAPNYGKAWTAEDKLELIKCWSGYPVRAKEAKFLNDKFGRDLRPSYWDDRIEKILGKKKYEDTLALYDARRTITEDIQNKDSLMKKAMHEKPITIASTSGSVIPVEISIFLDMERVVTELDDGPFDKSSLNALKNELLRVLGSYHRKITIRKCKLSTSYTVEVEV
jgi:hypothetical protein